MNVSGDNRRQRNGHDPEFSGTGATLPHCSSGLPWTQMASGLSPLLDGPRGSNQSCCKKAIEKYLRGEAWKKIVERVKDAPSGTDLSLPRRRELNETYY